MRALARCFRQSLLGIVKEKETLILLCGASVLYALFYPAPYLKQLLKRRGIPKPRIVGMGAPGWNLATHAASGRTERMLKGTDWDAQREPYADRVIEVIEQYCPNIRSIVDQRYHRI